MTTKLSSYFFSAQGTDNLTQQPTQPFSSTSTPLTETTPEGEAPTPVQSRWSRKLLLLPLFLFLIALAYFGWQSFFPARTPSTTVASSSITIPQLHTPSANTPLTGTIQVYIVGAVKYPGVYTLQANSRVYQLLQIAGGTLPNANLVNLNLAARLSDGQEIYVAIAGETPPAITGAQSTIIPNNNSHTTTTGSQNTGGQVTNINTATADELRNNLHISMTTANRIVTYRTEHGPYTSIDQLLQVVSKTIYNKIKNLVTL